MNPVTQVEIKTLTGFSKQFISRECKKDRLTMCIHNGKKMVDLDGHLTIEWLRKHPPKGTKPPQEKQTPIEEKVNWDFINSESNNPSGLSGTGESTKLKDIKTKEQIEELRIKNQQKRADLIQKKLIIKVFNKLYSVDENQLKPIGVNVMPKISSVYNESNSYKANQLLEHLEKKEDKELKSEILKILNTGEDDRINEGNQILEDEIGSVLKNIKREIEKFLKNIEELGNAG